MNYWRRRFLRSDSDLGEKASSLLHLIININDVKDLDKEKQTNQKDLKARKVSEVEGFELVETNAKKGKVGRGRWLEATWAWDACTGSVEFSVIVVIIAVSRVRIMSVTKTHIRMPCFLQSGRHFKLLSSVRRMMVIVILKK